jgi:RNA polymerase sigma-70 factor (ECF subfamily)
VVEDLYLACACLAGIEEAVAAFDLRCGQRIRATLGATTQGDDERREMEQRLRDILLVGTVDSPPKLSGYGGQGPLDRWVAVVAQRLVVSAIRSEQAERRAREGAALEPAGEAIATASPEVALLKQRYRAEFETAMAEALQGAPERDRLLLRLHLVGGVAVESIGKMYGVSQSTASRWLLAAREGVSAEVTRLLLLRLGLPASELRSLAGLVASQLDLSMSRLLKTG